MTKKDTQPALFALIKSMHDGVVQKIAEQVMQGSDEPWLLHVAAIEVDANGSVQSIVQDESKPSILKALVTIPDDEGVEVLVNIFLCDPIVEGKLDGDIGTGDRLFIYGRRVVSEGQDYVTVDIRSRFFNERTEHAITQFPDGTLNVTLTPFPMKLELDVGTLVFPPDGGAPYFLNTKKLN